MKRPCCRRRVATFVFAVFVGAAACSTARPQAAPKAAATRLDAVPRILVLTAMPLELTPLLERSDVADTVVLKGRRHYLATLGDVPVVLVAAGISMVNATLGAQAAIDHFEITGIVVCGIAGAPGPDSTIGDVAVPAQWGQYQEHVFTEENRGGWRRGWRSPDMGSFGMMYPQPVRVVRPEGAADEESLQFWFGVDAVMLEVARAVRMLPIDLQRCNAAGICVDEDPRILVGGNGVSGPTFVDDDEYGAWVWQTFRPDALDMETAAVAHVALVNGLPYLGVRAVSDLAGAEPLANRVTTFGAMAAANAAAVTEAWLRAWAAHSAAAAGR